MKRLGIEVIVLAAICTLLGAGTAGLFLGIMGAGLLLTPKEKWREWENDH